MASTRSGRDIEGWLTVIFAVAGGLMVANPDYAQALIGEIGAALGLHDMTAALAVTLTLIQLGYDAALLLLVSLADLIENRRLIPAMVAGAALGHGARAHAADPPARLWPSLRPDPFVQLVAAREDARRMATHCLSRRSCSRRSTCFWTAVL